MIPEDARVSVLFPNVGLEPSDEFEQVSRFEPATRAFTHYVDNATFDDFTSLEYGVGYQIYCKASSPVTVSIRGKTPSRRLTQELPAGWHLLPTITTNGNLTVREMLTGIAPSQILRYDPAVPPNGSLISVQATDPARTGEAYYVQVTTASTWQPPRPEDVTTRFTYDGDGGRVKQTTPAGTTTYLGESVEIAPDGVVTKYVFAGSQRIAAVAQSPQPGAPSLRYYHGDHLGSSNVITDGTGAVVQQLDYTPYGSVHSNSGSINVSHQFTGQRLDVSTGLYYFHARYYDPQLGRFTQPDTIVQAPADPQTLNRYAYARNNPLKYVDPTGHGWFSKIFGWVSMALSFLLPPLAPFLMLANLGMGIYTAARTGNWMGFIGSTIGSFVGGAVFGALGQQMSLGITNAIGSAALQTGIAGFLSGAISGAVEFGLAGFGAGLGGALGGGASFKEALKAGGLSAAVTGGIGAGIQGSYLGGLQGTLHGNSIEQIATAQGNAALQAGRFQDLAGVGARLEARTKGRSSLYLHGTDATGAAGIEVDRQLFPGTYVTKPYAVDPLTGKFAMRLNPAEFRAFTGVTGSKGDFFALVTAPSRSAIYWGLANAPGHAPQWRIYGEHSVLKGSPYNNPNQ